MAAITKGSRVLYSINVRDCNGNMFGDQFLTSKRGADAVEQFMRQHGYARISIEKLSVKKIFGEVELKPEEYLAETLILGGVSDRPVLYKITTC